MFKSVTKGRKFLLLGFIALIFIAALIINIFLILNTPKVESPNDFAKSEEDVNDKQAVSPDNSKVLDLKATDNNFTLSLLDSKGEILKEFESDEILDAAFGMNSLIYYQKAGDDFGIYAYPLDSGTPVRIINSIDPQFFLNIAFISDEKYFFIEPKTGKYGFGYVSGGGNEYLGQKTSGVESVVETNIAAFSNPFVLPAGENIFVITRSVVQEEIKLFIEAYPIDQKPFSNPVFSEELGSDFGQEIAIDVEGDNLKIRTFNLAVNMQTFEISKI
ncbi:hypothetical protein JW978_02265 [Candidatus Dojkabacteria bacterium]|nr:hypothetical protein [Candidatus Dojkabacteria bacterium]